jgi:hypothetical protein
VPKLTPDDLLPAAPDALRGDQTTARTLLQDVQQRAQERARDAVRTRLGPFERTPLTLRKPSAPEPVPPVAPNWPVEIRLQKGRKVRATLVPGAARREDLAAVADVSAANDRQAFDAIQQQNEAIESLRRSHAELMNKVATLQAQADRSTVGLLQGITSLEQQLQTARSRVLTQTLSSRRQAVRQQRALDSMATTTQIQNVNSVVNSMQAAAFGEKGSLLTTNNLLLAANQLLWQFIDPLLRGLGFALGPSPSLLTWLSPVGSLLTGQLVVGNRQHVRFISGVVTFDGSGSFKESESLRSRLSDSSFKDIKRRTDVPATAVPLDQGIPAFAVSAAVRNAVVTVSVLDFGEGGGGLAFEVPPRGKVAWMVDTGVDGG